MDEQKSQPVKVADRHPALAANFARDADTDEKRFGYLVERRDKLLERLLFGCFSINGASIVGLLAALGGKGQAAEWVGLDQQHAVEALLLFVIGIVSAGAATTIEGHRYRIEAAYGYARQSQAGLLAASFKSLDNQHGDEKMHSLMVQYQQLPLVDFQYSKASIILQNMSAGAWVAGILVPILHVMQII